MTKSNKRFALLISLALLFSSFFGVVSVNAESGAVDALINEVVGFNTDGSISDWVSGSLCESPQSSEWYVIGISKRYPQESLDGYADALEAYLRNNEVYSATTRQKYGLALVACGRAESDYLVGLVDDTIGKQGVMSYVFALHLLTNGAISENYRVETVIPVLLKLQCPNGGWSLTGKSADVDVTAMTVQALAPYYGIYPEVESAVDSAITVLSEMQREDGGFSSYGAPNPESAAQVIIALCSLGIDPLASESFNKNGCTLLDGITKYRLDDGSYCHIEGMGYNAAATAQCFLAFACLGESVENTDTPFLVFIDSTPSGAPLDGSLADALNGGSSGGGNEGVGEESGEGSGSEDGDGVDVDNGIGNATGVGIGYKLPACIAIAALTVVACVLLYVLKKRSPRNYVLVLILGALLAVFVMVTNFTTPDEYYGKEIVKDSPIGSVTIEIICDEAVKVGDNAVILPKATVPIEAGETVYDILMQVARRDGVKIDVTAGGVAGGAYVRGIGQLYEFDHGDLSGWLYSVNGERRWVACDDYVLSDGDNIVWKYSLALTDE